MGFLFYEMLNFILQRAINFETGIVVIDRSLLYSAKNGIYEAPTKTKNFRALRLSPQSLDMLQKWEAECERMKKANKEQRTDTPYVFVRDNGERIHPDSITYWLNKFSDEHNIPHLHPHAFRHTAASTLIANGVDLVTTAAEMGHANATTTAAIYAHEIALARANAADVRAGVFATLDKM